MASLITPIYKVLRMIVHDITHLPGGYSFWQGLRLKGKKSRHATLNRWAHLVLQEVFPVQLKQAALLACLNTDGVPDSRSRVLYAWVLKVVYQHNAQRLHGDWLLLKQAIENQPDLLFVPRATKKRVIVRPTSMPRKGMFTWHEYPPAKQSTTIDREKVE